RAKPLARDGHERDLGALHRCSQIARDLELRGARRVGKIADVAPSGGQRFGLSTIACPEHGRVARARELYGERRTPGAGAKHRDPGGATEAPPHTRTRA